jgi:hypothetical protein
VAPLGLNRFQFMLGIWMTWPVVGAVLAGPYWPPKVSNRGKPSWAPMKATLSAVSVAVAAVERVAEVALWTEAMLALLRPSPLAVKPTSAAVKLAVAEVMVVEPAVSTASTTWRPTAGPVELNIRVLGSTVAGSM